MNSKKKYRINGKVEDVKPSYDDNFIKKLKNNFSIKYLIWIGIIILTVYYYLPKPKRDWRLGVFYKDNLAIQDIICSDLWPGTCYIVHDQYMTQLYSNKGQFYVRSVVINTYKHGVTSMAELIPYPGEIFNLKNSAGWQIKKNYVIFPYIRVMAAIPFITETIQEDDEQSRKILSIGLGGSSLNNFCSILPNKFDITAVEIDPAMKEVATKWFGLEENEHHRVIVQDGVEYLENLPEEEKFDVIFIDACSNKREDNIKCPIPPFRSEELAEKAHKLVTEEGVVILNVYIVGKEVQEHYKEMHQNYKKFFKTCINVQTTFMNLVLACTNKELPKMTMMEYQKRFTNLSTSLKNTLKEPIDLVNYD